MKRVITAVLLMIFVLFSSGCEINNSRANRSYTQTIGGFIISEQYDQHSNILQRVEYNTTTQITTVYNYIWERNEASGYVCVDMEVITIDKDGKFINSSAKIIMVIYYNFERRDIYAL